LLLCPAHSELEFHIQLDNKPREALGLCDTKEECASQLYCRLNAPQMALTFKITLNFWFFTKEVGIAFQP